jgi:hypothetical protein
VGVSRKPEAAPALAGRGRFDGQAGRVDLAPQGLQWRGQGRQSVGQNRPRRGLLGLGALAEFGQGDGGGGRAGWGLRRRGETVPRHEGQQEERPWMGQGE